MTWDDLPIGTEFIHTNDKFIYTKVSLNTVFSSYSKNEIICHDVEIKSLMNIRAFKIKVPTPKRPIKWI